MKSGCEVCEIVIDPPFFAAPPPPLLPPLLSPPPPQAATTTIERAARQSASARLPSFPIQFPPKVDSAGGEHTRLVSHADHSAKRQNLRLTEDSRTGRASP